MPRIATPEPGERAAEFIDAGYRLLDEEGLDGLSVRAVLRMTGYNRKSFYSQFSDKDQLVLAVFARSIDLATAECRELVLHYSDPLARLERVVRYIVTGGSDGAAPAAPNLRRGAALCREHMRLAEAQPEELKRVLGPLIGLFAEQLLAGMDLDIVRREDPNALANFVYNLVSTTVHAVTLAQEAGRSAQSERQRLADQIWEFCRRGVAA